MQNRIARIRPRVCCFFFTICSVLTSGCASNLYRVNADIKVTKIGDKPDAPFDTARRGWYYSLVGSKSGKSIIRFIAFHKNLATDSTDSGSINSRTMNALYFADESELSEGFKVTYKQGYNFGTIVVPFKYRPARGGKPSNIFASSSLGPFLGYKVNLGEGLDVTPTAFAGFSTITLTDANTQEIENLFGLSYGGGLIFDITKNFQLGAVVGLDYLGGDRGAAWLYRSTPWYSFSIGYKFLNF